MTIFFPFPSFLDLILMPLSSGTPSLHAKILKKTQDMLHIKNLFSMDSTQIEISAQCSLLFFNTLSLCL